MRSFAYSATLLISAVCHGQVTLDVPLHLTGAEVERRIDGLGPPVSETGALSVEASLLGDASWAEATANGTTISLEPVVPLGQYRDGLLFRFRCPAALYDSLLLNCSGLDAYPLLRPDGTRPVRGQLREGIVCEVLYANGTWVLLNAPEQGCPAGTLQVNDRLCIETTGVDQLLFFAASERCSDMGGRLCSWGEFYWACTQFGTQLTGLLDAWEWVDDTANHSHTAVNVGFGACTAQRSVTPPINFARARCCFDPR